jgi:hypothetical protein
MSNVLITAETTVPLYVEKFNSKIIVDVGEEGKYSGLKVYPKGDSYFLVARSASKRDLTVNLILTIMAGNFGGSSIKRMERVSPAFKGTQAVSDSPIDISSISVFKETAILSLEDLRKRATKMNEVLSGKDVNLTPLSGGKSLWEEIESSRSEVALLLQDYSKVYSRPLSAPIDVIEIVSFAMAKYKVELENNAIKQLDTLVMPIISELAPVRPLELTKDLVNEIVEKWKREMKSSDPHHFLSSLDYSTLTTVLFQPLEKMSRDAIASANQTSDAMLRVVNTVVDGYSRALDVIAKESSDNYFISSTIKFATYDSPLVVKTAQWVARYIATVAVAKSIPIATEAFFNALDSKLQHVSDSSSRPWNVTDLSSYLSTPKLAPSPDQPMMAAASPVQNVLRLTKKVASELMSNGNLSDGLLMTKIAADISRADSFNVGNLNLLYFALQAVDGISTGDKNSAIKLTGIVLGQAKIGEDSKKIAFPLKKTIPILQDNLRILSSVDGVVLMLEVTGGIRHGHILKSYSDTIMNSLGLESVKLRDPDRFGAWGQFGRDGVMLRTCQSVSDIMELLQEIFVISTAVAVGPSGKDLLLSLISAKEMKDPDERRQSLAAEVQKSIDWYRFALTEYNKSKGESEDEDEDEDKDKSKIPQASGVPEWMGRFRGRMMTAMKNIEDYYTNVYIPSIEAVRASGEQIGRMIKSGSISEATVGKVIYAQVRSQTFDPCPYGLTIPNGCQMAGKFIDKLDAVLPNDREDIATAKEAKNRVTLNKALKDKITVPGKCKYLRALMKEGDVPSVVCNWNEGDQLGHDSIDFSEGLGAGYPNSFFAGLFSIPSALGPDGRESYMTRTPGTANTPFGQSSFVTPGM